MDPKTPPSTPVSESGTKSSERSLYVDLELKAGQVQTTLDYSTTQLGMTQKPDHAIHNETRKACHPEAEQAYRDHAPSNGLHEAREILIHDILASTALVQKTFGRYFVLLFVILTKDRNSSGANIFLEGDQDELLESLQHSLQIQGYPRRSKRDEAQLTSLIRALLKLSGGRIDLRQHGFDEEYSASDNADVIASVFGIPWTKQSGDFDSDEMCDTLSKSPVFSGMIISVQVLEEWTMKMKDSLRLGFREGHLKLPSQVLSGLSFGHVDSFNDYLARTSLMVPALSRPENNIPLLLTWSTMVSDRRQLEVLSDWASSADGWNLYKQLAEDFRDPQSVEQLALTMAALMSYRRLHPDLLDHHDQPIKGMYLIDLDALLRGDSLGNRGRVAERMVFALVCILHDFGDQFKDLIIFLETAQGDDDKDWVNVMHQEEFSLQELHVQDRSQRPYNDCTLPIMETGSSMKQSQADNLVKIDTITPAHIVALSSSGNNGHLSPPPDLRADQYTLIRLSKVEDRNMLETLGGQIGTLNEVPSIVELGDESWEICILKSLRRTAQDTLGKIFSGSDVDLYYNPLRPTANDLESSDYDTAKRLCRHRFHLRAIGIIKKGWPAAAACYEYLLEVMCEFRSDQPLVPTYQGFLQSKEDATYIVEACVLGWRVHSCRGPQDGEVTISGNIFVWEASITGIDRWRDGMEWIVREGDDFEVSEAIDGSGLMKKTISIRACGTIHHVVSYYDGART